jgi:hypothetical protein
MDLKVLTFMFRTLKLRTPVHVARETIAFSAEAVLNCGLVGARPAASAAASRSVCVIVLAISIVYLRPRGFG